MLFGKLWLFSCFWNHYTWIDQSSFFLTEESQSVEIQPAENDEEVTEEDEPADREDNSEDYQPTEDAKEEDDSKIAEPLDHDELEETEKDRKFSQFGITNWAGHIT